jgi:CheY-like chemotaxis protein
MRTSVLVVDDNRALAELHCFLRPRMPSTNLRLMTALATDERISVARAAGITQVLSKAFDPAQVTDVINRACPRAAS